MVSISKKMKLNFKPLFIFLVAFFALGFIHMNEARAQICPTSCANDNECQVGCGECWFCNTAGACEANDTYCENLAGECQTGQCTSDQAVYNLTGCTFEWDAQNTLCYYCDPGAIVSTCGDGICTKPDEDCTNCPNDCILPGYTACTDTSSTTCGEGSLPPSGCEDGDVCTFNSCPAWPFSQGVCVTIDHTCSNTPDLCCPEGCVGPADGVQCQELEENCDIDCCGVPDCGNGFVDPDETCDETVPGPNAGINVTDEECRSPGAVDECTYCGDGIIQTALEECDGSAPNACDAGCDTNTCLCIIPVSNLWLEGSGNVFNSCSLTKGFIAKAPSQKLEILGIVLLLGGLLVLRRRFNH